MDEQKLERLKARYQREVKAAPRMGPGPGGRRGRFPGKGGKPKNAAETIKRLFSYIGKDKSKIYFVFIFVILQTIATLTGSYMLRPLINKYIVPLDGSKGSAAGLAAGLLLMAAVYIVGVVSTYLQAKIMIGVSQRAIQKIRSDLFDKIQQLSVKFFDTNSNGELMSRFTNDVDTVGEMLNHTLVQLFAGVITLVGTFALMLYTNFYLALVTGVILPLLIKTAGTLAKRSRKFFSAQQAALGAVNGYIEETVSGQKVVKVFCHEETACEEFELLNNELKKQQIMAQFSGGVMGPVMGNISKVNYALTAAIGGLLCIAGKFDVGGLTIFVNFANQFSRPINEISMQVSTIFSALAGAERVFAIMDTETEYVADGETELEDVKGEVELKNVTFGYTENKTVLKNISLSAEKGQKIAFVGSTGAGKTTITNLINRFYDIIDGEITIDGINIKNVTKDSLRSNIAMVLQDTHLFTGTVRENIRYGRPEATDEEVVEAAKVASAHSFIERLPNGYDTMIEGDGMNLSQGQRQLLNIARAAISKAPILILDEATSSVDTRTEKLIDHGMDRLMESRTTFVIAHRLSTIRNADAIMVLENGVIIERGKHQELLENRGRYYELYTGLKELD